MENSKRDYWWLLALEATLFFSYPCWALTAPWAEPATYPARFWLALGATATVAMLTCHVGPAFFAARFGGGTRYIQRLLMLWFGAGYMEWLVGLTWSLTVSAMRPVVAGTRAPRDWTWLLVAVAFLAVVFLAAATSWWKALAGAGLALGVGVLVWSLVTSWKGLWVRNSFWSEDPLQFDSLIVEGMLVTAAPAFVIGWRIGQLGLRRGHIWMSGLVGLWLPMVLSVAVASLAAQGGANLHWVPSLPRGFEWALVSINRRLGRNLIGVVAATLVCPAVVCVVSLKQLAALWPWRRVWVAAIGMLLLIGAISSILWQPDSIFTPFATPIHNYWAAGIIVLGAVAGLCAMAGRLWQRR